MTHLVSEIIEQIKDREYFGKKARKTNSQDDWRIYKDWFGLVYWGLTPQQQPGSYQGGEMIKLRNLTNSVARLAVRYGTILFRRNSNREKISKLNSVPYLKNCFEPYQYD